MNEAPITAVAPDRCDGLIGADRALAFAAELEQARRRLDGRTIWYVSSTAKGGGVAEILSTVLGYLLGADISVRWLVIDGNAEFFELTKRIHHRLHGSPGDDGPLDDSSRAVYERALSEEFESLLAVVEHGDPVVLNDPQTLGLAPALAAMGMPVIWSCHVGTEEPNALTREAWAFLQQYLAGTKAQIFSRQLYAWDQLDPAAVSVIPPCVDPFSAKNQQLPDVSSILAAAGFLDGRGDDVGPPVFARQDGTEGRVTRRARMHQLVPLDFDRPVVTQISRWDPLKDHLGLLRAFTEFVPDDWRAQLLLVGPAPDSVDDDPEGEDTYRSLIGAWEGLPTEQRARTHIAALPMDDPDENAAVVNAIQRRSDVIVQKSLAEGFGLTVAEAMYKERPVVASGVGGIQDQIDHHESGLLVHDPNDLKGFGRAITRLLSDTELAGGLGKAAADRVIDRYLPPAHLGSYLRLIDQLV